MKKILSIFIISITVSSVFAQDSAPSLSDMKREKREDMLLMNFNWNYLLNTSDSLRVKGYSWGYDLKLMYDVPIQNSNFSFAAGGALGIMNFYTNSEIHHYNLNTDSSASYFVPISDSRNVKNNKLTITYADIPFEVRYRSKPNKKGYSWKVAAGVKVGYHLQTRTKLTETVTVQPGYTIPGENGADDTDVSPVYDKVKSKSFYYPNYEKWRYGVNLRVAYGRVGVNAFYSATSIFEEGKGDKVFPVTVGITLMPF